MSVHHERLVELCSELRLGGVAAQYPEERYGANISTGTYFGTAGILSEILSITKPITTTTGVTPGWPEPHRLIAVASPHHQPHNWSPIPGAPIATI